MVVYHLRHQVKIQLTLNSRLLSLQISTLSTAANNTPARCIKIYNPKPFLNYVHQFLRSSSFGINSRSSSMQTCLTCSLLKPSKHDLIRSTSLDNSLGFTSTGSIFDHNLIYHYDHKNTSMLLPLDIMFAGFNFVDICLHIHFLVFSWMTAILLLTKTEIVHACFVSHTKQRSWNPVTDTKFLRLTLTNLLTCIISSTFH